MRLEVLREGIKTNTLKSILFPEDVVANISRIVSDIQQVFPVQVDHFIIGPMGKIGWGTPPILTLELGLLLELPEPRIAILGVLKALLPEEEEAILKLQINFLGVIDFENQYISFDASLYDSRLLTFTLTGDMAFRLSWGAQPLFILSVGGFHPSFRESPADLQHMTRLSLSLASGENPRLTIQCYFAVTSNTVQFGAKVELYAEAGGFNVYGYLGLDVLFQFEPFHFIADLYAGLALRRGSTVLMGITLSGELSGPTPWDVRGEASISLLFFSVSVSFHETWGETAGAVESETIDLLAALKQEVQDVRNWKADLPEVNHLHVTIKQIEAVGEELIVHPFGVLTFSERLAPLEVAIEKFGVKVPEAERRFELTEVKSGETPLAKEPVKELFASANYFEMSDEGKLSAPSFEGMVSGFKLEGSGSLQVGLPVSRSVEYELTYLRKRKYSLSFAGIYKLAKGLFRMGTKAGAVARAALSYESRRVSRNAPEEVEVLGERYGVARVSDMQLQDPQLMADSYREAVEMMQGVVAQRPELQGKLQILSNYELSQGANL